MEHLSLEALSRLVDEAPTGPETDHLGACARCASELDALRLQSAALGTLPIVRPPRGDWDELEARLRSEGLVRARERGVDDGFEARVAAATPWLRHAAAVALFVAGAATGAGVMARMDRGPEGEMGSAPVAAAELSQITDPGAALAQVHDLERAYIDALTHYSALLHAREGGQFTPDPERRYAALEQLVEAGQAAVSEVPADPFLNGLLATALAERAAYRRATPVAGQDGWF